MVRFFPKAEARLIEIWDSSEKWSAAQDDAYVRTKRNGVVSTAFALGWLRWLCCICEGQDGVPVLQPVRPRPVQQRRSLVTVQVDARRTKVSS